MFLLKGPNMDLFADRLTRSELQCWYSNSKDARDTQGGKELFGLRARAGGAAFSQRLVLAKVIIPLLSHFPPGLQTQAATISESASNWLNPFTLPW